MESEITVAQKYVRAKMTFPHREDTKPKIFDFQSCASNSRNSFFSFCLGDKPNALVSAALPYERRLIRLGTAYGECGQETVYFHTDALIDPFAFEYGQLVLTA